MFHVPGKWTEVAGDFSQGTFRKPTVQADELDVGFVGHVEKGFVSDPVVLSG